MSYSIAWTEEALSTFEDRVSYLKIHFTEREITKFKKRVSEYLTVLETEPLIAIKPGRLKNVHMGVIIKQVSVIYRVKPIDKKIELISFIDNRQNPKRIKKYKP